MQRLVDQRLSPLYVSVHATEPEVRSRLLVNERAGEILEHLRFLLDGGLEVHTQAVLCPGWNDGAHLDRTIEDLWGLGEGIRSLSVVPVGLTRYNLDRPVRLLRPDEAVRAIEQIDRARERARRQRGSGWCYAADEMYLIAARPVPEASYYDDGALYENGVGAVRRFVDLFDAGLGSVPRLEGRRVRLVTGRSMAPFLRERAGVLAEATGAEVEVMEVANDFFGETCTVAGLLAGEDILRALGTGHARDIVVLPAEALNADALFIDSVPLARLETDLSPAMVVRGYEVTETLRQL
jgi:putative radical SAM enzyme (TIGR03279 family)